MTRSMSPNDVAWEDQEEEQKDDSLLDFEDISERFQPHESIKKKRSSSKKTTKTLVEDPQDNSFEGITDQEEGQIETFFGAWTGPKLDKHNNTKTKEGEDSSSSQNDGSSRGSLRIDQRRRKSKLTNNNHDLDGTEREDASGSHGDLSGTHGSRQRRSSRSAHHTSSKGGKREGSKKVGTRSRSVSAERGNDEMNESRRRASRRPLKDGSGAGIDESSNGRHHRSSHHPAGHRRRPPASSKSMERMARPAPPTSRKPPSRSKSTAGMELKGRARSEHIPKRSSRESSTTSERKSSRNLKAASEHHSAVKSRLESSSEQRDEKRRARRSITKEDVEEVVQEEMDRSERRRRRPRGGPGMHGSGRHHGPSSSSTRRSGTGGPPLRRTKSHDGSSLPMESRRSSNKPRRSLSGDGSITSASRRSSRALHPTGMGGMGHAPSFADRKRQQLQQVILMRDQSMREDDEEEDEIEEAVKDKKAVVKDEVEASESGGADIILADDDDSVSDYESDEEDDMTLKVDMKGYGAASSPEKLISLRGPQAPDQKQIKPSLFMLSSSERGGASDRKIADNDDNSVGSEASNASSVMSFAKKISKAKSKIGSNFFGKNTLKSSKKGKGDLINNVSDHSARKNNAKNIMGPMLTLGGMKPEDDESDDEFF